MYDVYTLYQHAYFVLFKQKSWDFCSSNLERNYRFQVPGWMKSNSRVSTYNYIIIIVDYYFGANRATYSAHENLL